MYQLILSDVQWKAMQSRQALSGIDVTVSQESGGRFIIVMDRSQWQLMQDDLKMVYTQTIAQQINVHAIEGTVITLKSKDINIWHVGARWYT